MAVLVHSTSNDLYHVTAQEFTNRVEFVKKWNERTDATNAAVRARALQAKKEILAGAFFADVAKKYADFAPEEGETWETFHLDEFDGDDPLGQGVELPGRALRVVFARDAVARAVVERVAEEADEVRGVGVDAPAEGLEGRDDAVGVGEEENARGVCVHGKILSQLRAVGA